MPAALSSLDTLFSHARQSATVNSDLRPQATSLTPDQVLAVVYFANNYGDPFCSGTLVADRFVATIRRCVPDAKAEDV